MIYKLNFLKLSAKLVSILESEKMRGIF